jgi:hypothetical protein
MHAGVGALILLSKKSLVSQVSILPNKNPTQKQSTTCSRSSSMERRKKSISETLARSAWFSAVSESISGKDETKRSCQGAQTVVLLSHGRAQLGNLTLKNKLHFGHLLAKI